MVNPITPIDGLDSSVNQTSGPGTIQRIMQAIKQASARTGVDFSYLVNKASQESGFDTNAKASGSSAMGLFQFTSQTWLQMIKTHGSQYGLGAYAEHISADTNGVLHVNDANWRHAILALRKDPAVSAEMAGELDKENAGTLQADVGGKIGPTELYLAHFLGAGGASDFLNKLRTNPQASAANLLPEAAASNPSVFFDKNGAPRSLAQIYQHFAQKFDKAPQIPSQATMLANADTPAAFAGGGASNIQGVSNNHYEPSVISNTKASSPTLYSAMVIAQMDLKGMVDNQLSGMNGSWDGHKKNSTASALYLIS